MVEVDTDLGDYLVPLERAATEYEVKKSRFIATAIKAGSREEAMDCLALLKKETPDARHHCWAYLIGRPQAPSGCAFSDDGEPNGTAGKPILNVLQHKEFGDIVLVVARYFGGIKLGAGGLVRAYSHSAQQTMSALKGVTKFALVDITVVGDFSLEQPLRLWLSRHTSEIESVSYAQKIQLSARIRQRDFNACEAFVRANNGSILGK